MKINMFSITNDHLMGRSLGGTIKINEGDTLYKKNKYFSWSGEENNWTRRLSFSECY